MAAKRMVALTAPIDLPIFLAPHLEEMYSVPQGLCCSSPVLQRRAVLRFGGDDHAVPTLGFSERHLRGRCGFCRQRLSLDRTGAPRSANGLSNPVHLVMCENQRKFF